MSSVKSKRISEALMLKNPEKEISQPMLNIKLNINTERGVSLRRYKQNMQKFKEPFKTCHCMRRYGIEQTSC